MIARDLRVSQEPYVLLHGGVETLDLWTSLRLAQPNIMKTREVLLTISDFFVNSVCESATNGSTAAQIVPLVVMRGGIIFLNALWRKVPRSSIGFIIPARGRTPHEVRVLYTDVPFLPYANYILFDLIANTGDTIESAIRFIRDRQSGLPIPLTVQVAAPFSTIDAAARIKERFPDVVLHTLWNGLRRRANGWLEGLDFDAGDLAFGVKQRLRTVLGNRFDPPVPSEMPRTMTKVAALIRDGDRILVVRKNVSDRNEFITPGGKPSNGECQEETLRRELTEELEVTVSEIKWFGLFEDQSTFENLPMTMDVYDVRIEGTPKPSSEIVELSWIDTRREEKSIALGNLLKNGILPALRISGGHETT